MSAPLSWRAEWSRQVRRRRTLWVFGILLALPPILVGAFALDNGGGDSSGGNSGGPPQRSASARFVDLATSSGSNFTVFTLLVSSGLLLYVVAALFAGDPVPAEASWSSLRYLLTAPVTRARLLTSKLVVGVAATALAVLVLTLWTLIVGYAFYGFAPFSIIGGGELAWDSFLPRLALAVVYLLVNVLPIGALAFWLGVRTDTPLAAVGGSLIVLIVANILDAIDALGGWRNALPGHDLRAWLTLLTPDADWTALQQGTLWSLLYTVVFLALGYLSFRRKDILS